MSKKESVTEMTVRLAGKQSPPAKVKEDQTLNEEFDVLKFEVVISRKELRETIGSRIEGGSIMTIETLLEIFLEDEGLPSAKVKLIKGKRGEKK